MDEFRRFFLGDFDDAAEEIEGTDRIPDHLLERTAELGALGLTVPERLGGYGLPVADYLDYLEIAAQGPGAGRMLVHVANGLWRPLADHGSGWQRDLIPRMVTGDIALAFAVTEPEGGTGRDVRSRATKEGTGWRITGSKHLITFADRASFFILLVATDDRRQPDSLTTFVVPRETAGFDIDASQRTMGLRGTGHARIWYDMVLDDEYRLGDVGRGLDVVLGELHYSRISLATCMVGVAQRALDESLAFARRRSTFGRPIITRQAIQGHLAQMYTDIQAARSLVRSSAERLRADADYVTDAATCKLFCLQMVSRVTDLALRVHGGYGYTTDAPIERIYRDARGFWFEEGTAEIQQLVIARHLAAST